MKHSLILNALLITGLATACGGTKPAARVFFNAPADGASVSSPVHVTFGADNFTVEPAGTAREGAGHLHLMLDTDCVRAGEVIPKDAAHVHYGQGQLEADLELAPGAHTLCLQAANGAHTALAGEGMTHQIRITVK